jgi:hypothetical protein
MVHTICSGSDRPYAQDEPPRRASPCCGISLNRRPDVYAWSDHLGPIRTDWMAFQSECFRIRIEYRAVNRAGAFFEESLDFQRAAHLPFSLPALRHHPQESVRWPSTLASRYASTCWVQPPDQCLIERFWNARWVRLWSAKSPRLGLKGRAPIGRSERSSHTLGFRCCRIWLDAHKQEVPMRKPRPSIESMAFGGLDLSDHGAAFGRGC